MEGRMFGNGILAGYKTYIVAGLAIAGAVGGYLDGALTPAAALAALLGALGLGSLRSAISGVAGK